MQQYIKLMNRFLRTEISMFVLSFVCFVQNANSIRKFVLKLKVILSENLFQAVEDLVTQI